MPSSSSLSCRRPLIVVVVLSSSSLSCCRPPVLVLVVLSSSLSPRCLCCSSLPPVVSSLALSFPFCCSPFPPREQLLAAVVGGAVVVAMVVVVVVVVVVIPSPSLLVPSLLGPVVRCSPTPSSRCRSPLRPVRSLRVWSSRGRLGRLGRPVVGLRFLLVPVFSSSLFLPAPAPPSFPWLSPRRFPHRRRRRRRPPSSSYRRPLVIDRPRSTLRAKARSGVWRVVALRCRLVVVRYSSWFKKKGLLVKNKVTRKKFTNSPRDAKRRLLGLFSCFVCLPVSRRRVPSLGVVVPVVHSRRPVVFELHRFPPREQLLAAAVPGAGVVAASVVAVVFREWRR